MAELESTPNNQGRVEYPDIQSAYISLVRNLVGSRSSPMGITNNALQKRRRALPLKRYESIKLVRDYATCMNEMSCLQEVSEQKVKNLEALSGYYYQNVKNVIPDRTANKSTERLGETLTKSIELVRSNNEAFPRLLTDLKSSLDVLFQLRTIEQNEIALIAESNNRAILVFTGVTIIFLPLSFFTSYFGMNLKGVVDTDRTERFFWTVCGTVTVLFGFKERLYRRFWEERVR
ncbi:MAG: hypothetical protein Q9200_004590 [Gallowayella weberi]